MLTCHLMQLAPACVRRKQHNSSSVKCVLHCPDCLRLPQDGLGPQHSSLNAVNDFFSAFTAGFGGVKTFCFSGLISKEQVACIFCLFSVMTHAGLQMQAVVREALSRQVAHKLCTCLGLIFACNFLSAITRKGKIVHMPAMATTACALYVYLQWQPHRQPTASDLAI